MVIPSHGKREAAMDFRIWRMYVRTLQGAAGQHGFLGTIEGNFSEFFPIADQVSFDNDFMKCQITLLRN